MSKQKMLQARDLIREKRFEEARAILQTVDHPTAEEWLRRLDKIDPPVQAEIPPPARVGRRSRRIYGFTLLAMIIVIAVVSVGVIVLSTNNTSAIGLERFFPEDTALYAAIRTDPDHLAILDDLAERFNFTTTTSAFSAWPRGVPVTITGAVDMTLQLAVPDMDFETGIRPWLGDMMAVGAFLLEEGEFGTAVVVEITDRAGAIAFVEQLLAAHPSPENYTQSTEGDYTVYVYHPPYGFDIAFMVNDEVLIYATHTLTSEFILEGFARTLADSTAYGEAMDLLPEDSYNAFAYINITSLADSVDPALWNTSPGQPQYVTDALLTIDAQQAFGLTWLDDRSVVVDVAQNVRDVSGLLELGLSLQGTGPVNRDFLANVPADAAIVIQGTDFKTLYELVVDMARINAEFQSGSDAGVNTTLLQIGMGLSMVGLNLQEDVIDWLTGDYALFLSYDAPAPGAPSIFTSRDFPDELVDPGVIQAGLVIEATDPAKARHVVDAVADFLTNMGLVATSREQIGGANAIVISIPQPNLSVPVEIVIGADDNVFVIATREAATAIFNGQGGFNNAPGYVEAQRYMLNNETTLWFVDSNVTNLLGDGILALGPYVGDVFRETIIALEGEDYVEESEQEQQQQMEERRVWLAEQQQAIRDAAAAFTAAAITTTGDADWDSVIRLVWIFAE